MALLTDMNMNAGHGFCPGPENNLHEPSSVAWNTIVDLSCPILKLFSFW